MFETLVKIYEKEINRKVDEKEYNALNFAYTWNRINKRDLFEDNYNYD